MVNGRNGYSERGLNLIRATEVDLQTLLAEAARDGQYDSVSRLAAWAKQIRTMIEGGGGSGASQTPRRAMGDRQPREYPKFYRSDDRLVLIGWAKKSHAEYEHKVPRLILDQLVTLLTSDSTETIPVSTEALLEGLKAKNGGHVPDYYGRTLLRWFRALNLVEKHGNSGYTIKNRGAFANDIEKQWAVLPSQ